MWLTAQKRFLWHVCLRNPFPPNSWYSFLQVISWRDQRVGKSGLLSWESQFSSNARVDIWVVNQWWIRMILRRKFYVPEICCPRSIQATHTHACHSEVSIRLFGSFWFVVSKDICWGIVVSKIWITRYCAFSCDMWLLQTNEPLSRLSF